MFALEGNPARLLRHIEQRRNNSALTDVFRDVFFRVIRPHLFLIDVLFEDIPKDIGIDLASGARRAVIKVPIILFKETKDALESFVWNFDVLAVEILNLVLQKKAALRYGTRPNRRFVSEVRCSSRLAKPSKNNGQRKSR